MDRKDYMSGRVTFADYYRSIAKSAGISYENADPDLLRRVRAAMDAGDEHLNTIPLREWDARAAGLLPTVYEAFRAHGDHPSKAGLVCLLKQAARDAVTAANA